MDDSFDIGVLVGVLVALAIVVTTVLIVFNGAHFDAIDVKALGEKMCAEHGLEYSHREISKAFVPIIYCKKSAIEIEDGYLKMVGESNVKKVG